MNSYSITLFLSFCFCIRILAIPAYPRKIKYVQGVDTIWLTLRGDEHIKYAIDANGYTALHDSTGWFYAKKDENGEVIKSSFPVQAVGNMSEETKSFLASVPRGLCPSQLPDRNEIKHSYRYNSKNITPITGERRVLIILMQYNDVKLQKSQNDFDRLFNERNYRVDGAYGSVYDYYNKVSYGKLQLVCDILGPYTASHNMSYYGGNSGRTGNDMNPKALFDEAVRFAIKDVNLKDYDSDNDGFVDNIHIIFAGYGEEAGASANAIWSHEMTFRPESVGGMSIDHYSCSPELRGNSGFGISRIGPPCHEIGHALGAMDFYDVDYQTGGYYEGTGDWDVMASGSWNDDGVRPADFNPYVKVYNYGWTDVKSLVQDTLNIISPSNEPDNIYRIDTPVNGDFFLLDNRQPSGITAAEPGKGLLIFHIGPGIEGRTQSNTINSTYPQQCYVVCASSTSERPHASASSYGNISSAGCPYPGTSRNRTFTTTSVPAALTISGHDAKVSLTNITQQANGDISVIYGKTKTDDVTPGDDPVSDDDVLGEIVWSDDFEVTNFFSQTWSQQAVAGNGSWKVHLYSTFNTDKEPEKGSGIRYLAMESVNEDFIHGNESRYSCKIISSQISLSSGTYILVGEYAGYANLKIPRDTLHIELLSDNADGWITIKSLRMTTRNKWNTFYIPIDCSENTTLQIGLTGSASKSSLLFVDNLRIYRVEDSTSAYHDIFIGRKEPERYSFDGILLNKSAFHRGINIVRKPDGKVIKMFSR